MSKRVKSKYSETWLENNVIHQSIDPSVWSITLPIAKQLIKDRYAVGSIGIKLNLLLITNNATGFDKDGHHFHKQQEPYDGINAMAILADNYTTRLTFTLVIINQKTLPIPAKLFNNKDEALEWLKQFDNNN